MAFNIRAYSERGEENFTCTGDNTELYLHGEQYEEVNHIFHRYDTTERALGAFLFRSVLGDEEFDQAAKFMIESAEYVVIYRPVPTDGDFDQYLHHMSQDLDGGLDD
jgi:hypothetical protein